MVYECTWQFGGDNAQKTRPHENTNEGTNKRAGHENDKHEQRNVVKMPFAAPKVCWNPVEGERKGANVQSCVPKPRQRGMPKREEEAYTVKDKVRSQAE